MKWFSIAIIAPLIAGCGFSPMYGQLPEGASPIGPVAIAHIDGRAGHVLKTELDRMLAVERGAGPPLELDIQLGERVSVAAYRLDESATLRDLRLIANYILRFPDGAVTRGSVSTMVQYSVPAQAFGEVALQDDARERAAEQLAVRMRAELALRVAGARRQRS